MTIVVVMSYWKYVKRALQSQTNVYENCFQLIDALHQEINYKVLENIVFVYSVIVKQIKGLITKIFACKNICEGSDFEFREPFDSLDIRHPALPTTTN